MVIGEIRLNVVFFRSDSGTEPVRKWLKSLPRSHKKAIGEDIKTVQFIAAWIYQEDKKDSAKGHPRSSNSAEAVSGNKTMKVNKHIGSNFDDFLQEENLLAQVEATAIKRVIAYQIEKEMAERQISKSKLASMMRTSRSSLNRLLDPENPSVTLLTLESVALALGKKLKIQLS